MRGRRSDHLLDNGIQITGHLRRYRAICNYTLKRPVQPCRLIPEHLRGITNAGRQRSHVTTQTHGIGARFNYRNQRRVTDLRPNTGQRGRNRRWVMGKVIVDADAIDLGQLLHAPLGIAEPAKRSDTLRRRHANVTRGRKRR